MLKRSELMSDHGNGLFLTILFGMAIFIGGVAVTYSYLVDGEVQAAPVEVQTVSK